MHIKFGQYVVKNELYKNLEIDLSTKTLTMHVNDCGIDRKLIHTCKTKQEMHDILGYLARELKILDRREKE